MLKSILYFQMFSEFSENVDLETRRLRHGSLGSNYHISFNKRRASNKRS